MAWGFDKISGTAKAIWALITIAVSIVTAIASTAIYISNRNREITDLETKVDSISKQLKVVSALTQQNVDFNGNGPSQCGNGSFMVGIRISVDPHLNSHGTIICGKVQPQIE
jgi:hypothetical protein